MAYRIVPLRENFWAIEQEGVRAFLLAGAESAVLVDSCFGGDLLSVCQTLTDRPITLLTTHADGDHIGSDDQFPVQYMHPAEMARYENHVGHAADVRPLWDGDVFRVGAYTLEVLHIPGHTEGSVAFLERSQGFLLAGDSVQGGCMYMHELSRSLTALQASLEKLDALRRSGAFDTVYACHGPLPVPADILEDQLALVHAMRAGTLQPVGPGLPGMPKAVKTYRLGRASMYYMTR